MKRIIGKIYKMMITIFDNIRLSPLFPFNITKLLNKVSFIILQNVSEKSTSFLNLITWPIIIQTS